MDETTSTTPPPPPSTPPPTPRQRRVLRRRDGHLGGVAAGLAHHLDVDATLVRFAFVLLGLVGGSGVFLYLAGWLLIPTEDQDPSDEPVSLRSDSVPAVLGAVVLALAAWAVLGPFDGDGGFLVPVALIAVGVWLLSQRPNAAPPAGPAPAPAPGWPATPSHPAAPSDPATPSGSATASMWPGEHPAGGASGGASPLAPAARGAEGLPAVGTPWSPDAGWEAGAGAWRADPGTAGDAAPPPPPTGGTAGWAVPHGPGEPAVASPGGPPITSITLAVLAVVVGVLFVLDTADAIELTAVAVAATALVVIGVGLLASAFLGRARGLLPLGLLAALGLAVAPAADLVLDGGVADRVVRVTDAAELADEYRLGVGSLVLDLSELEPADLDRELEVGVGIGYAEVLVPDDVRVVVEGRAALGYVQVLGRQRDGAGVSLEVADGPVTGPTAGDVLVLDADVRIGALEVRRG